MLTRSVPRGAVGLAAALLLVLAGLLGTAGIARADVSPCDNSYVCVVVGTPGGPGGSQGGSGGPAGGSGACYYQSQVVPCYIAGVGTLDSSDGCYYTEMQPQPPAGDPLWQGHQPGDGAIYVRTCALNGGGGTVSLWMAAGPPAPVQVSPGELAHMAVARLPLESAVLMTAPHGKPGLVKVPVMLWLKPVGGDPAHPYGYTYAAADKPLTVSASVPGLTVTAKVWSPVVTWDTGDGDVFTCPGPGVAFNKVLVNGCTHTYAAASKAYAITATVSWTVSWSGGGQTGAFDMDAKQAVGTTLEIEEIQVLN